MARPWRGDGWQGEKGTVECELRLYCGSMETTVALAVGGVSGKMVAHACMMEDVEEEEPRLHRVV